MRTSRCSSWIQKRQRNRDQIANICWIMEKAREFQKNIYFCFIDYTKVFDCMDHNKLENSERDGNTRPPDLPLEESVCRSRSNSQNWSWNNRLVTNRKRSTSRLYIITLLIQLICRIHQAQLVKNPPAMQETPVRVLGQEDPLEKGQATHSTILGLPSWLRW